jgi:lipopolysaccharide biosynthesis protein
VSVGKIASRSFWLPSEPYSEKLRGSVNCPTVLELAEKMGYRANRLQLDFFGETMFWVRPEALKLLRPPPDFPEESGRMDGKLEQAVERLFDAAVVSAGSKFPDVEGPDSCGSLGAPFWALVTGRLAKGCLVPLSSGDVLLPDGRR